MHGVRPMLLQSPAVRPTDPPTEATPPPPSWESDYVMDHHRQAVRSGCGKLLLLLSGPMGRPWALSSQSALQVRRYIWELKTDKEEGRLPERLQHRTLL